MNFCALKYDRQQSVIGTDKSVFADLRSDQTQRGGHGPTEDRRAQGGVRVTVVMTGCAARSMLSAARRLSWKVSPVSVGALPSIRMPVP